MFENDPKKVTDPPPAIALRNYGAAKKEDIMSESPESKIIVPVNWDKMYAKSAEKLTSSAIREILKRTMDPSITSFAGGYPANEMLPFEEVRIASNKILTDKQMQVGALQYGPTEGYIPLKEYICEQMQKYGVPAVPGNVTITNGAQGGIFLIGLIFIEPGTTVLVERPTYLGVINPWRHLGANFVSISVDKDGMVVDELPGIIEKYHPKIIYTMPNFHNPLGVTMSLERRKRFAEIVSQHDDIMVVEDDPYGKLRYTGDHLPPIISLLKDRTFRLQTVSKVMAPGLRVGWIVAPEQPLAKIFQAIQGECLYTSTYNQMIVNEIYRSGVMEERIKLLRKVYGERRAITLDCIDRYFPKEVQCTRPDGGLFLWATTPPSINTLEFFDKALAQKVAFVPGASFYANGEKEGLQTLRVNFSYSGPEKIEPGMKVLGNTLKEELVKK